MSLLRAKQICPASELGRKSANVASAIRLLAQEARAAGLHEWARDLDLSADDVGRVGVEAECAARSTFVAARRGEELPS